MRLGWSASLEGCFRFARGCFRSLWVSLSSLFVVLYGLFVGPWPGRLGNFAAEGKLRGHTNPMPNHHQIQLKIAKGPLALLDYG